MGLFDFLKKDTLTHYSKVDNDTLKCFMLNGAKFVWGYGGYSGFETRVMNYARADKERLTNYYKNSFYFPFKREHQNEHIEMLSDFWEINNKQELFDKIESLKQNEFKEYKAYVISAIIHLCCFGYGAKYLSETEALSIIKDIAPVAKVHFKSWNEYWNDFIKGVHTQYGSHWGSQYEEAATLMQQGNYSIYKIINW